MTDEEHSYHGRCGPSEDKSHASGAKSRFLLGKNRVDFRRRDCVTPRWLAIATALYRNTASARTVRPHPEERVVREDRFLNPE